MTEAEIASEQLVSVLRMLVASGLLLFFAVTVGPLSGFADSMQKRQWLFAAVTMGAYCLVGLGAWTLGRAGLMRRWMIWVTVTTDCVFLLVNIWLSLSNTGLSGQVVFALPPVWLIPMALAFGMLRVNPAVQIYITVVLVLGIGAMLDIGAGTESGFGPALGGRADQVGFFLATPPNLMRLSMIALTGAVLAVAAARTRRLLLQSIVETQARANLTRYLPAQISDQLAEGRLDELRRGRREEMAILFVDMRDFTTISEGMTPEEVSGFVSEFRARLTRAVQGCGGMIDKFMGDAAMIVFPAGGDPAAAACCALRCADRIRAAMEAWSEERPERIRVGIGGHWGEVFSGVVGDDTRLEYSVFGDPVNVAARLEGMTKELGAPIVVSRDLLERAGQGAPGEWRLLGRTGIRGRDEGLDVLACAPEGEGRAG
ncbi:hypothetical protein ATO3_08000 [Marinibacterium profundimaris]|uniref:Guanylate cyclase domain-containing protein n=1 Tax=Marinibacterium profundimaris TaxID=1679460 RepID=A0A225NPK5_9RHOB|nr:hypothetical protein ATO3_08000 [Marinibacterium profundimaris]